MFKHYQKIGFIASIDLWVVIGLSACVAAAGQESRFPAASAAIIIVTLLTCAHFCIYGKRRRPGRIYADRER